MSKPEWLPAVLMMTCFLMGFVTLRYCPFGETTVLVHVPMDDGSAVRIAAMSDSVLLGIPGQGLAILRGDASAIRKVVGFAAVWNGRASCGVRL